MTSTLLPLLPSVYDVLFDFAQSDGFWANLAIAFGTSYDVVKATQLQQQWKSRNFSQIPQLRYLVVRFWGRRMVHIPAVPIRFIYQHLF